jgi:CubicO group peptidase (beta-lactamase class C family)
LLIAVFTVISCTSSAPKPPEPLQTTTPDEVLQSYVDSGRVPGVVAVAATGDRILHEGAFGKNNVDAKEAMQLDTIFRIASMTKPVTSVAVMQLVEQGKVSLDASVAEYLPQLGRPKVLEGFDDAGKPRLRDAARPPTIRELLANTSGYAYSIWNDDIRRYEAEAKLPRDREKFPLLPLAADPGVRWEYSPSTAILGILVETVSGLTLEEYFRQHIFAPLGMHDTFFQVPGDKWSRVTRTYQRRPDGGFEGSGQEPPPSPPEVTYFAGDGGLLSTAPDYIRFVRALLNDGELDGVRVLKAETVELMVQNHIGDGEAGEMISFLPERSNDVHLFPGAKDKFGLGFLFNVEPVPGGRAEGTLMWAGLYNTYFWIDRKKDVGGVLLTQILPFADTAVLEMLGEYEKAIYAAAR